MKKILVADELSYSRGLLSFALSHSGYDVVTADTGPGAIAMIKGTKPDLAILDSRLPRVDGLSVLRAVRALPEFKDMPVFLLNAGESREHILNAIQIGVQEYILKSQFDTQTLLARIQKCLGAKKGTSRQNAAVVEEVWENVEMPAASSGGSLEIEGDMEPALPAKKSR